MIKKCKKCGHWCGEGLRDDYHLCLCDTMDKNGNTNLNLGRRKKEKLPSYILNFSNKSNKQEVKK